MKDDAKYVAIHEAGHAFANVLFKIPFHYVTIVPEEEDVVNTGGHTLGYIMPIKPYSGKEESTYSKLIPDEFFSSFSEDVTILAGSVAEALYRKKFNKYSAKADIFILINNRLINHPEPFRSKYRSFLISYTYLLLKQKANYKMIVKIADELMKKKTLDYDQVRKIINR